MKALLLGLFLTALAAPAFADGTKAVTTTTAPVAATVVTDAVGEGAKAKDADEKKLKDAVMPKLPEPKK